MAASREPRKNVQPWRDWAEFALVRDGLFACDAPKCDAAPNQSAAPASFTRGSHKGSACASDPSLERYASALTAQSTLEVRRIALARVLSWRAKPIRLPVAVECTIGIAEALAMDSEGVEDEDVVRNAYAIALVRFINLETARLQRGNVAAPVHRLASELGVSNWLVELRHNASHSQMPTLMLLRAGAAETMRWLYADFWRPAYKNGLRDDYYSAGSNDDELLTLRANTRIALEEYCVSVQRIADAETSRARRKARASQARVLEDFVGFESRRHCQFIAQICRDFIMSHSAVPLPDSEPEHSLTPRSDSASPILVSSEGEDDDVILVDENQDVTHSSHPESVPPARARLASPPPPAELIFFMPLLQAISADATLWCELLTSFVELVSDLSASVSLSAASQDERPIDLVPDIVLDDDEGAATDDDARMSFENHATPSPSAAASTSLLTSDSGNQSALAPRWLNFLLAAVSRAHSRDSVSYYAAA